MTYDAWIETPRKLTHQEARMEQLLFWRTKSAAERLAAMTALTRSMYRMRGIDLDEQEADWGIRRIPRRRG